MELSEITNKDGLNQTHLSPTQRLPGRPKREVSPTCTAAPGTRKTESSHVKQWKLVVGVQIINHFPVTRLPTNKLVMQRHYTLRQDKSSITPKHWYVDTILNEIKDIWERAYVPIVSDKACIARIKTVLQSWDKRYCRRMKVGSKQLQDYQDYLNSLCDLAHLIMTNSCIF